MVAVGGVASDGVERGRRARPQAECVGREGGGLTREASRGFP